jgi:tetratricopeptide (TPR) repeat protein
MDPTIYAYYERLRANPDDAESLAYLWEFYATRGEFQQLATLAEQIAGRRSDTASAADLFYRAGEIWAKNVGRPDKAVACYKRSFELDGGQYQALDAAYQIYVQIGNLRAAAPLLERALAVVTDPMLRVPRLREAAGVYAQAGDLARRIACLDELCELSPDDWDVMRDLAEALIARSQTPQGQPDDGTRAASLLGALAVAMGPEHGLAFAEIALDTHPGDELAYQVIHEAYGAAGRSEELAMRQIAFVTTNPTSVYTPTIRRALAEMYAAVGQVDDAITCLEPLVGDDPSLTRQLAGLYRQAGRVQDLAALLEQLAPSTEPEQRLQDMKDLAALQGAQGDRAAMIATMRAVLAESPADTDALTLVEDDLKARGAYVELRDLLLAAVGAPGCPPDVRIPKLRELGRVNAAQLNDVDAAIEAWREVVETIPTDVDAMRALGELLERNGQWEALADVLAQCADLVAELDERRAVLAKLADVHRDRRDDPNAEAVILTMLWEITPDDDAIALRVARARRDAGDPVGAADVMRARLDAATADNLTQRQAELGAAREAAGQLTEAIEAWREVVGRDPEYRDGWPTLERLLARSGQHAVLYATLVNRAEALPEGVARAALHARAADAARAMGDTATALSEAERAVQMAPDDDSLAGALMNALEASGQRERLLAFVRERTARLADGEGKVELLRRAARVVGLSDATASAGVWQELRDVSKRAGLGDDPEALDALMGLAELKGDLEALAGLFVEAAAATREPEARREILKRRASLLANELGRVEEGVEALAAAAREYGADHAETWQSLERMALDARRFDLAGEAIERLVALTPDDDDDQRAAQAARLVEMVEREVNTPEAIIHALGVLHRADPGDLGVIQRLADLCESEGRYRDAIGYLDQLLEIEGDDEEISKLSQRIAHLSDEKLGDAQRAWEVLLGPVKTGDVACIEMVLELATKHDMHAAVVPILAELSHRVGDRSGRSMLWREVARRKEQFLGDTEGAFEAWVSAAVALVDAEDLARIDALAPQVKRPQRVADAYKAALDGCGDPTLAHELSMRGLGAIEASGGRVQAFEYALAALAKAPADDEVLDAVVRLVPSSRRHSDLFVAFDRRKKAAQSDAERFGVTLRAAETAGGALGDRDTAFQYVEQAIGQAIGRKEPDEEMLARVENACIQADQRRADAGMVSGLVERYARMAEDAVEDSPRVSAVLLRRAGALCEQELALMDHALGLYTRAVSVWPDDVRGAAALEDAAGRMSRLGDVVNLYTRVIDEAYDARVARTYTGRRASLLADRLGRVEEAIEAYQRLAELAPKDLDVVRALQSLLERHGRWQALLMALERESDAGGDRASVFRRMAVIWETRLKNVFEARDIWRRVLKLAPGDEEAKAALERLERRPTIVEADLMAFEESAPNVAPEGPAALVYEAAPVYADAPAYEAAPVYADAPVYDAAPVYADAPVYDAAPVHADAPAYEAAPAEDATYVFDAQSSPQGFFGHAPSHDAAPRLSFSDERADMPTVPPPVDLRSPFADVSPPQMPALPTFTSAEAPAAHSFLEEELSAEYVANEAEVHPVWPSAGPGDALQEAPTPPPPAMPSMPPPLPRMSFPPSPPALPTAPAESPFDALSELSMSDAEEVEASEIDESEIESDDAPSLDDLAALTTLPGQNDPARRRD